MGILGGAGSGDVAKEVFLVGICELVGCFVVDLWENKAGEMCGVVDESRWEAIVGCGRDRGKY